MVYYDAANNTIVQIVPGQNSIKSRPDSGLSQIYSGGNVMNREYALGLVCGIVVSTIILAVLWKMNRNSLKGNFDERQMIIRGSGYKLGMFAVIILLAADILADGFGMYENSIMTHSVTSLFILVSGVLVYALYCIRYDAYLGMGMNIRRYAIIIGIVILAQIPAMIIDIRQNAFIENGKLAFGPCSRIMMLMLFTIIIIALFIRGNGREAEDSEE